MPSTTSPAGGSISPCDVVVAEHVGTAFGGTATLVGNTVDLNPQECTWTVAGALNGNVEITVLFPDASMHNGGATDAVAMVHYNHDFTIQNYPDKVKDIEEVSGVGEYAFIDTWTKTLQVALSPALAVSVQFVATPSDFGQLPTDVERAALSATALAVAPDLAG